MNLLRKIKLPTIIIFLVLLSLAIFLYFFKSEAKEIVKIIIQSELFVYAMGAYVVCCAVIHQIGNASKIEKNTVLSIRFGKYSEIASAIILHLPATTSSIVLLRGIFMQYFYEEKYYPEFDSIDLTLVLVVSSFILYDALNDATTNLMDAVINKDASQIAKVSGEKAQDFSGH